MSQILLFGDVLTLLFAVGQILLSGVEVHRLQGGGLDLPLDVVHHPLHQDVIGHLLGALPEEFVAVLFEDVLPFRQGDVLHDVLEVHPEDLRLVVGLAAHLFGGLSGQDQDPFLPGGEGVQLQDVGGHHPTLLLPVLAGDPARSQGVAVLEGGLYEGGAPATVTVAVRLVSPRLLLLQRMPALALLYGCAL